MKPHLKLFIGGPGHEVHEEFVKRARNAYALRDLFADVRAFDDEVVRPASSGTQEWLSYLRGCDVAVFFLPADKSGSTGPKGRFNTAIEVEQARLSGAFVYLLKEEVEGKDDTGLVKAIKEAYGGDLSIKPVKVARPVSKSGDREPVLSEYENLLSACATDWQKLCENVVKRRDEMLQHITRGGRPRDVEGVMSKSSASRDTTEWIFESYLNTAWEFRKSCSKDPELPRYLLRAYYFVTNPTLSPEYVEDCVRGAEDTLWERLSGIVSSDPHQPGFPVLSDERAEAMPNWRQNQLLRLLRETSVGFRYKLKLKQDWNFARRAMSLYLQWGSTLDPDKATQFDLAIAGVTSAAYALKLNELGEIDPTGSYIDILREHFSRGHGGAAKTLGDHAASSGNLDSAVKFLSKSIEWFADKTGKERSLLHSQVALACCKMGGERNKEFEACAWKTADPIYVAMAQHALEDLSLSWEGILKKVLYAEART
jgi:hypothetical protein